MIDDEFEVCFELLLSVMLGKRRQYMVPVRVPYQSHIPGAQKKTKKTARAFPRVPFPVYDTS
jgi:hypothetical protein